MTWIYDGREVEGTPYVSKKPSWDKQSLDQIIASLPTTLQETYSPEYFRDLEESKAKLREQCEHIYKLLEKLHTQLQQIPNVQPAPIPIHPPSSKITPHKQNQPLRLEILRQTERSLQFEIAKVKRNLDEVEEKDYAILDSEVRRETLHLVSDFAQSHKEKELEKAVYDAQLEAGRAQEHEEDRNRVKRGIGVEEMLRKHNATITRLSNEEDTYQEAIQKLIFEHGSEILKVHPRSLPPSALQSQIGKHVRVVEDNLYDPGVVGVDELWDWEEGSSPTEDASMAS
ncbi:hypothetical protein HK097_010454 [Rhizophlyctis rosea]|uniref:Uncharacterized protein n=1 Tax=Rhizophlyctis rosea TaxID=64517 RepID=A0AAD5X355_9FUNG|nr:hypothetical protein HK097_010454 [Rhizophlyctis rosea]